VAGSETTEDQDYLSADDVTPVFGDTVETLLFEHMDELRAYGTPQRHRPGHAVFEEGQRGETVYILVEGTVELIAQGRLLTRISESEIFGEMALLDGDTRSATARCMSDCELIEIPRVRFEALCLENFDVVRVLLQTMSKRIRLLNQATITDSLTGAFVRDHFLGLSQRHLSRAVQEGQDFAVMTVEVDQARDFAETKGFAASDRLMAEVARVMMTTFRPGDIIGRMGPERLGVCLPITAGFQARIVAARLVRQVAEGAYGPDADRATVSVGVAGRETLPEGSGATLPDLFNAAEIALEAAKDDGYNCAFVMEQNEPRRVSETNTMLI